MSENCARTKVKVDKFTFTWTIENFSIWCNEMDEVTREDLISPKFSFEAYDKIKWLLKMGISKENVLSLFLLLEPCSMTSGVYVKPKFCILNIKKEQENISSSAKIWLFCEKSRFWGLTKFIEKNILFDKAANLLPDDELTIVCEIGMVNIVNICDQPKKTQYKVIEGKLNENLGNLLDNGKLSDVTFFVGDREVQAHKALLISRSDVFAAMFQHDMEESQINRIVVSDIDYDVLKEMLKFIYTDKAPNLDEMAHDLLAAADKYALENLKVMCEETLCTKISAENAAETLILADLHSATQLKAHAMDFIKTHITEVMPTRGWENMCTTHTRFIVEVSRMFAKQ